MSNADDDFRPAVRLAGLSEAPASINFFIEWSGFSGQITLRDDDEFLLVDRVSTLMKYLTKEKGITPQSGRSGATAALTAAHSGTVDGNPPMCPTHNVPMKAGKNGGWYCSRKIADDDGAGKPVYCKQRVSG